MKKVAIFASGTGSNFEKIADDPRLQQVMSIEWVICDVASAAVITKAKQRGLKTFVFCAKDFPSKQAYEQVIFDKIAAVDFIFLAGYMRMISSYFLALFKRPIINLHPSLLPKYKGKDAIKQALEAGESETGISIHYVNEEMDGGEIITQERVAIEPNETLEQLTRKVHALEHRVYPATILQLIQEG